MWIAFAVGSALFSGLTAILAKCGIRDTDPDVATALRTGVVLIFAWIMAFAAGSVSTIADISPRTWLFLVLSGLATGASWLCYFRALQIGDVNKVTPVDKSSTVMAILLGVLLLNEPFGPVSAVATVLIGTGTLLMVHRQAPREDAKPEGASWLVFALLSALFAALTAILGKVGIEGVESNLGTAIRTVVVLSMAWLMVAVSGKLPKVRAVPRNELGFLVLSGLATGAAWLCYFRALQEGPASIVVPIDKLSIVVTVIFAYFVFGERLDRRAGIGLILIVVGTLVLAVV